jgi:hypothetical protein
MAAVAHAKAGEGVGVKAGPGTYWIVGIICCSNEAACFVGAPVWPSKNRGDARTEAGWTVPMGRL